MSDLPQQASDINKWLALGSSSRVPGSNDVVDRHQIATSCDQQRVEAQPELPVRKRGRPRKTAAGAAQTAARHASTPAESGHDARLGAIDNDGDALSDDEDERQRTDRPCDELEGNAQAERFRKRTKASTAQQYAPTIKAYQAWCRENNITPEVVSLGDVHKLGRFYDEYCSGKWLPPSGGRNRKGEGLQGSAAKNVHSALVKYVGECCIEAGVTPINPIQDSSYHTYYKQHTANRGQERACTGASNYANQQHVKVFLQGAQLGGCAQPDQQQPYGELPLQQQQFGQQPAQQQQSKQAFKQQQHTAEANQNQPQPEQHWQQQGLRMTVQLVQRQIQLQQEQMATMPPGPQRINTAATIQDMRQQLLQLQQALLLQPGQQPSAPSSTSPAAAAAAANFRSSSMTGQEPAEMPLRMKPATRSNPDFRSARGSSLSGAHGCSCSAAAELLWCADALRERLQEIVHQAVQKAVPVALQQAGFAAAAAAAAAGAAGGTGSPAAEAAAAAQSTSSSSRGAPRQQAGTGCEVQREVPFLRDQKSLPDMMQWYTQERDVAVEEGGKMKMYTRSELRDQGKSWASRDSSRRAAEYDVIYDRLKAVIVQLTKETNQPKTMDDAVQHVVQTAKVCQPGGISIYKYMQQCRDWRKAREQTKAMAGAAACQGVEGT